MVLDPFCNFVVEWFGKNRHLGRTRKTASIGLPMLSSRLAELAFLVSGSDKE